MFCFRSFIYEIFITIKLHLQLENGLQMLEKEVKTGHEDAEIPLENMDIKALGKKSRKYYRYMSALTTPCTEGVIWNVLAKVTI